MRTCGAPLRWWGIHVQLPARASESGKGARTFVPNGLDHILSIASEGAESVQVGEVGDNEVSARGHEEWRTWTARGLVRIIATSVGMKHTIWHLGSRWRIAATRSRGD